MRQSQFLSGTSSHFSPYRSQSRGASNDPNPSTFQNRPQSLGVQDLYNNTQNSGSKANLFMNTISKVNSMTSMRFNRNGSVGTSNLGLQNERKSLDQVLKQNINAQLNAVLPQRENSLGNQAGRNNCGSIFSGTGIVTPSAYLTQAISSSNQLNLNNYNSATSLLGSIKQACKNQSSNNNPILTQTISRIQQSAIKNQNQTNSMLNMKNMQYQNTQNIQPSAFLNKLSSLQQKSKCYTHQYINEFFCLPCHREVCSHCLLTPHSGHYGHQALQIKDHLQKSNRLNKENMDLCDNLKKKFKPNQKSLNKEHTQKIVEEKQNELSDAIDHKIESTINKLRVFQEEVKRRYTDLILANLEQIENDSHQIHLDCSKTKTIAKTLQKALDQANISEVVTQQKSVEKQVKKIEQGVLNYEELKKACQEKREGFKNECEKGTDEILNAINMQLKKVNKVLDIPRYKQIEICDLQGLNPSSDNENDENVYDQRVKSKKKDRSRTSNQKHQMRSQSAKISQKSMSQKENHSKLDKVIIQLKNEQKIAVSTNILANSQQIDKNKGTNSVLQDLKLNKFGQNSVNNNKRMSGISTYTGDDGGDITTPDVYSSNRNYKNDNEKKRKLSINSQQLLMSEGNVKQNSNKLMQTPIIVSDYLE